MPVSLGINIIILQKMRQVFIACILALAFPIALLSQPASFVPRGIGGGGALFFPTINPANDNEYYVACDMSELFHSTDFGLHYDQLDFQRLQAFNTSTYEFTNDPQIAYSNFNDGNSGYPVKTTDGGASWQQLGAYDINNYGNVYKMSANYADPNQLLIAAYGDIVFSGDGGATFSLVKHATNMGAGLIMGGVLWDGGDIYIGTNEGILRSTNGGSSFAPLSGTGLGSGQVIWSFAGAKSGNSLRFTCITADVNDVYNGVMPWDYWGFAKGVYVMDNANGTWLSASTGLDFNNNYVMYVGMATNDINTIYLAGNDNALGAPLVVKSSNGGSSWAKKFNTTTNANIVTGWEGHQGDKTWGWSETCFGITVAPNNSSKVIFPTYSNVQTSTDGGNNWRQAYVDAGDEHPAGAATPKNRPYHSIGLENTTCWQVFWADSLTMMGCYSDIGGIRSTDGGVTWGFQYSGFSVNSLYRMVRGADGNLYGGCSNIHDMYQSTRLADAQLDANDGNGKIVYSSDHGATWANLHVFNHPVFWLATDPTSANRMYASVIHYGGTQGNQQGGIYVTTDLNNLTTAAWTKLPNPPRTEGHPASIEVLNDGKVVCTFSGRRAGGAFTASSGVYVYDPQGGTWADVSDPGMHYWTKDIVIDPHDAAQNTWYVNVFSGWGGAPNGLGGLYKTTNRGTSWSKLTGTQFDRVTSLTFDPQATTTAYLTTETQGLWISADINAAIPSWTLVSSYNFRQPERVYFNPYNPQEVWVSSFGNGMKMGNLGGATAASPAIARGIRLFPNPSQGRFTLQFAQPIQEAVQLQIVDMTGRILQASTQHMVDGNIAVDASGLPHGMYIVQARWGGSHWSGRMLVE
jgi:Secretion system C-terminal sorting domain